MTNTQSRGCLVQAEILDSSNVERGEVEQGIRDRIWDFSEARMRIYREANDMAISEMRRKIKTLLKQSRTITCEEIDTYVECEPVGMISDGGIEAEKFEDSRRHT